MKNNTSDWSDRLANLPEFLERVLAGWGFGGLSSWASRGLLLAGVALVAMFAYFIARPWMIRVFRMVAHKTKSKWDDALVDNKVIHRLAHLVPAMVIYFGSPLVFPREASVQVLTTRVAMAYMILIGALTISAFLSAVVQIYDTSFVGAKERPIRSYVQVVKIILWILAIIVTITTLMDRSPWGFLTGLGAMTAIILLVFKDAILGLVASIQLSGNDMVRVGDWIEMPDYGADGDVIEISLTTVKVRNWDKTISTVPTYKLISEAFKNWRGMKESGGRRIKRFVLIDLHSIRFLDDELLKRLKKIQYIQEYLDRKVKEVQAWNTEKKVDVQSLVNGRRLTNVGTFRAYVVAYLRNHPQVHDQLTFLVRQPAPTERGLPIEVYVFSREQRWAYYEDIQSDIFDHILAAVPEFDLRVVQNPTGADVRLLGGKLAGSATT